MRGLRLDVLDVTFNQTRRRHRGTGRQKKPELSCLERRLVPLHELPQRWKHLQALAANQTDARRLTPLLRSDLSEQGDGRRPRDDAVRQAGARD
jgi:hypothetical protein